MQWVRYVGVTMAVFVLVAAGAYLYRAGDVHEGDVLESGKEDTPSEHAVKPRGIDNSEESRAVLEDCDYEGLRAQAEHILEATDFDQTYWVLNKASSSQESYPFAWGAGGEIQPCSYTLRYTSPEEDSSVDGFTEALFQVLRSDDWHDEPSQTFMRDSTNASTTIMLAHAGGPLVDETVFTKSMYAERTVQFVRVVEKMNADNFIAYRDGTTDSSCPCRKEMSLEISKPILFSKLFE